MRSSRDCWQIADGKTTRRADAHAHTRGRLALALSLVLVASLMLASASAVAQAATVFSGSTAVGQSSQAVPVAVTMIANGVAATPQAVTLGVSNGEFVVKDGTCIEGASYSTGQQCDVSVVFQPKFPGVRSGAVVLLSGDGRLLGSTLITSSATGSLSVLAPGEINTVAGATEDWLYQGDGVPATGSPIFLPMGVAVDAAGNLFLADSGNERIRRVDAQSGLISTVAGNGTAGYSGDGGLATEAMISDPGGLVLDGAGNLYFADSNNDAIRRVDAVSGIITTVAGTPRTSGSSGNGDLATAAKLSKPEGVALDVAGDLYIADTGNNAIREVSAATGIISGVAGTGTQGYNGDNLMAINAELSGPYSLSVGADGSLYIADTTNQRVRKVAAGTGIITTLAGTGTQGYSGDGGIATAAALNAPAAVLLDPAGNVYIADSGNNRIRQIDVATGDIQTLSGTSTEGFSGDGGPANLATMYGPYSLFFDQSGDLFFSDLFNNRVREIYSSVVVLPAYPVMRVGKVSAPQAQGLVNDGNANLTVETPALVNAALDPATTTCNASSVLTFNTAGNSCNFGVEFAPTAVGADIVGTVTAASNAGNSPAVIDLSGQVLTVQPTTLLLASSLNPSLIGVAVTFTATISAGGDTTTGSVSFLNNGAPIAGCSSVAEETNQKATCKTSALPLGSNSITSSYSGDANDASSVSNAVVQTVKQPATVVLMASPNPVAVTANVALTATVTAATGMPGGTITFYDGTTAIGSANLSGGGAFVSTTALSVGMHTLTAEYSGDGTNAAETSNVVNENVQQAATKTTLTSSSSSAPVGNAVSFTATVTSADGPAPEGTVTFMNGSTELGSGTIDSSGTATLSLASLSPGNYSIVATYTGDADDASSNSAAFAETIQQIPTAITLTANTNPVFAGATLNLTALVAATGSSIKGGTLSGNVTFSEGATVYGTVLINGVGSAILPLATLSAGTHSILASYAGDTNYAASASTLLSEVVQSTATTTTLSSLTTSSLAGETATFTATVVSTTAIPKGTVTFDEDSVMIGQGALNAQGIATFSATTLEVGSDSITAVYAGNQNYNSSASLPLIHTVTLAAPTLILTGPSTTIDAGTTFATVAKLSSSGVAPMGTMTLRNGSNIIGTDTVTGDNAFSFGSLSLGVGTYQLTATYSGDANNAAVESAPFTVTVQLTPTTTSLLSSANPSTFGQAVTLTATASGATSSPTGLIEFLDGGTVLGSSLVGANGIATLTTSMLSFGTHSITASYEGDADRAPSTSTALTEKIVEAASGSVSSSLNPSIFGSNVLLTVTIVGVGSVVPTGTVVLHAGSATLGTVTLDATGTGALQTAALPVGANSITATYSGDTNYSGTSASLTQTVLDATTQTTLAVSQNPAIYGTPVTFTASVTGNGGSIQSGSVNFTDAGALIGSATLNASGMATLTLSTLAPGTRSIVASYVGYSDISPSKSTPQMLVVKELTASVLASSANPASTLSSILLTARVTNSGVGEPTGTVTFVDGTNQLGVAALDASGVAMLTVPSLSAGNHVLAASYAGDTENFSSTSSTLTQGIQLRPTTTALSSSATDPNNPLQITLISVVNGSGPAAPTGTVTFTSGATVLGSSQLDAIGVATLDVTLSASSEGIVAAYNGDASYAASSSLQTTISGGTATQFTLQLDPPSMTFQSKQHATTSLTLSSLNGFSDTLQLGCLGLPDATTCTFSTPKVSLAANGTATVQLTVDTGDPLGAGATAMLERRPNSGVLLCFLPGLLCVGLGARRRKMRIGTLLIFLCMAALTASLSGCSGLSINGTPAGTYTFKVTASGEGSGATVSQAMTLTVTP